MASRVQQDRQVYDKTSSPTALIPALFNIFAIAAKKRCYVASGDVGDAYLNDDLEMEPLYIRLCRETTM